ncbi:unnamed protein product [Ceratitis capitata]|uniref:(Mediterranean fruit fly) hypothetical protein n=1 Tax=Ceratitis capitata TaxID=7213 RepID=A0A811UF71_CERCA|nr:unnamed protein product [Ceratitis capitata]
MYHYIVYKINCRANIFFSKNIFHIFYIKYLRSFFIHSRMIPIWQMMLGVCIGVVALILVRPRALPNQETNQENRKRNRKNSSTFTTTPGDSCVICLDEMTNSTMAYLRCGHALHDKCLEIFKSYQQTCPICSQRI